MAMNVDFLLSSDGHIIEFNLPGQDKDLVALQAQYPHSEIKMVTDPTGARHGYLLDSTGKMFPPRDSASLETIHNRRFSVEEWGKSSYITALISAQSSGLGSRESYTDIRRLSILYQGLVYNTLLQSMNDDNLVTDSRWNKLLGNMVSFVSLGNDLNADIIAGILASVPSFFSADNVWIFDVDSDEKILQGRHPDPDDSQLTIVADGYLDEDIPLLASEDAISRVNTILGIPEITVAI